MADNFYTTSQGYRLEFVSIPQTLRKFVLAHPEPKRPQYPVESKLTGVTEYFDLDETTAETDEEKAALNKYNEEARAHAYKLLRICLIKGVRVHASMDAWAAEQKELEIPVAESEIERRIEWITETILATQEDFQAVTLGVLRASGASEEAITQIEASFRGEVGESNRAKVERPAPNSNERELVLQQQVGRVSDRIRDGATPKPIRQVDEARPRARARRKAH